MLFVTLVIWGVYCDNTIAITNYCVNNTKNDAKLKFVVITDLHNKEYGEKNADYMDINTTFPNYLNIPLMAGLNYSFGLTDKVKLYGEFGIGLNIRIATKFMLENEERGSIYDGYYYYDYAGRSEVTFKYDNATSFAYQLGVGVLFDKVSIGLHWYNLGSAKVKGKVEETISVNDYISGNNYYDNDREVFTWKKLSTSMLTLTVGYHF